VLERAGAFYASLSGSGSALYGLFRSRAAGEKAAVRLRRHRIPAVVTNHDDPAAVLERRFQIEDF